MPAPPIDFDILAIVNHPGVPILDPLMRALSFGPFLIALSVLLGLYILIRSPQKKTGVLVLVAAIGLSDAGSARLIKPWAERVRPCNLAPPATETLEQCQRGLSFPSNHAANVAAAAVVASWAAPVLAPFAILIALAVGVSRVYLGQHWPTDVLAGWALGSLVAFLLISIARLRYSLHRRPVPQGRST